MKTLSNDSGAGLIEVMIASVISLIIALSLLPIFSRTNADQADIEKRLLAEKIADSFMGLLEASKGSFVPGRLARYSLCGGTNNVVFMENYIYVDPTSEAKPDRTRLNQVCEKNECYIQGLNCRFDFFSRVTILPGAGRIYMTKNLTTSQLEAHNLPALNSFWISWDSCNAQDSAYGLSDRFSVVILSSDEIRNYPMGNNNLDHPLRPSPLINSLDCANLTDQMVLARVSVSWKSTHSNKATWNVNDQRIVRSKVFGESF